MAVVKSTDVVSLAIVKLAVVTVAVSTSPPSSSYPKLESFETCLESFNSCNRCFVPFIPSFAFAESKRSLSGSET